MVIVQPGTDSSSTLAPPWYGNAHMIAEPIELIEDVHPREETTSSGLLLSFNRLDMRLSRKSSFRTSGSAPGRSSVDLLPVSQRSPVSLSSDSHEDSTVRKRKLPRSSRGVSSWRNILKKQKLVQESDSLVCTAKTNLVGFSGSSGPPDTSSSFLTSPEERAAYAKVAAANTVLFRL